MGIRDWTGSALIIVSVVLIAVGGKQHSEDSEQQEVIEVASLIYAILAALFTGLALALNGLHLKYVQGELKFPGTLLVMDQCLVFGLFMTPFYVYH
jgi:drug/metabolite transporter (DMT)-like permease